MRVLCGFPGSKGACTLARMKILRPSSNFPGGCPLPHSHSHSLPQFHATGASPDSLQEQQRVSGRDLCSHKGCTGADLGQSFTQTLIIEMRHLDVKRIQRHFLVDGKRQQPRSHGEHKSRSALGVFNFISALNHAALAHFLFMKIEIGSECGKMEWKGLSVVAVAVAVAAMRLFG